MQNIKNQLKSGMPAVTFWIRAIENYLSAKSDSGIHPKVYDVFAYEAIKVMLQARFARCQLIIPQIKHVPKILSSTGASCHIKLSPLWQVMTTSYKLTSILPSENGWRKLRIRKGIYYYLLIATSEKRCKFLKINGLEFQLLKDLSESSVHNTGSNSGNVKENIKTTAFRRKMEQMGIFETERS
jgi:hypothetical protein